MIQSNFDTNTSQKENQINKPNNKPYSTAFHLLFGGIIFITILLLSIIFSKKILQIGASFPFFSTLIITTLLVGFGYYFYKVITLKKAILLKNLSFNKGVDFFNLLQIIVAITGVITATQSILSIVEFIKQNLVDKNELITNHYNMVINPLYVILICLIAITIFWILSLRIKEIISELSDNFIISYDNKKTSDALGHTNHINYMNNFSDNTETNALMTKVKSQDTQNETHNSSDMNHEKDSFLPPNYDNGFLYKKLFEISDNVQNLKQQIFVAKNDNVNETIIHELWDTKISPFLNTLSEQIKTLEERFDGNSNFSTSSDNHKELDALDDNDDNKFDTSINTDDEKIILPVKTDEEFSVSYNISEIQTKDTENITQDFIKIKENKITPTVPFDNLDNDNNNISDDTSSEETFAYTGNEEKTVITKDNKSVTAKNSCYKEKTLKELSSFLENKMNELYKSE